MHEILPFSKQQNKPKHNKNSTSLLFDAKKFLQEVNSVCRIRLCFLQASTKITSMLVLTEYDDKNR